MSSERAAQRIVVTVLGVREVPVIGVVESWEDGDWVRRLFGVLAKQK
jgi:hypothetical protein